MKRTVAGIVCALAAQLLMGHSELAGQSTFIQSTPQPRLAIVSDWTNHHVLYPDSKDAAVMARVRRDPRWLQNWYLRHRELWWKECRSKVLFACGRGPHRDWSVPLEAAPVVGFGPLFDFSYGIDHDTGYGNLNATDIGSGQFLATAGSLTITATESGVPSGGTYPLYPGGPGVSHSPGDEFFFDDVVYPSTNSLIDGNGLLFVGGSFQANVWGNIAPPVTYGFEDWTGSSFTNTQTGDTFTLTAAPGAGQTWPAKFSFDVNSAPSCTNDYVVIGIPASPAAGGQANIVGLNNLYSGPRGGLCTTGPTVMFAYASGTGQVPASLTMSLNGSQIAYIENLPSGSSYFHNLTLGTTGTNGTGPTASVLPGSAGGNNAVDQTVLLSPDGGTTNQSSTTAPWIVYTSGDADDWAYATTYTTAAGGSGYLYKITNVFNGGVPTIVWSIPIDAIPSTPVYDSVSNKIFFTDSNGRLDYVEDVGTPPSVVYGAVLASGDTAENSVVVDSTNEMVYATFNSNGTNALIVQAPTSMASSVSAAVGTATTVYSGPYEPSFNNAWFTGTATPLLYIAGTGSGAMPTLYSVGFNGSGVMNSSPNGTTAALTTGEADASPVTGFYNATLGRDFLFVGVTDYCPATAGGTAGCVMSLDITNGFPTVNAGTTALAAAGGTTAIIIDNDSSDTEASSIYYATKSAGTLVKATQAGLD
jgi:hypothetical protein